MRREVLAAGHIAKLYDLRLSRVTADGMIRVVISPALKVLPASAFAWLPDGRVPAAAPLPPDLGRAETQELRLTNARQAVSIYTGLLQRAPSHWRGWIYLRLARTLARAGDSAGSHAALRKAASIADSPGSLPTQFAARFELASASPEEAARLYRDLNAGTWLLEKAPYSFYEMRLRGLVGIAEQSRPVETSLPPGLPAVQGDREALSSAVLNLLDSAIKYSPPDSAVSLRASGANGWVTIAVGDKGCGITPEEQRRIFDRFYRGSNASGRPAKGVGLGLALVKRIADAHGARIRLESTPGQGSTFFLSL